MKANSSKSAFILLALLISNQTFAQSKKSSINQQSTINNQQSEDPVLITIAGEKITKSEFLNVYYKNSKKDKVIDTKSLEEYLTLYINFRLKVKEAEDLGMDTTKAFKKELEGYRKQLARPYLTDRKINEKLLNEAYQRKLYDIRASHILIKLNPDAEPKDTLLAYRKIIKIRKRIIKGEEFETVAKQVSDDKSVKDNEGDLGYFTVFQSPFYSFESAAYNTEAGKISMPVQTGYGYHLIKVTDKRDALNEVKVAHIMIRAMKGIPEQEAAKAKNKIDEIYKKILDGEKFEDLVKQFSEDKTTVKKGGELPLFRTGKMVGDFEKAVFDLKNNGDISQPVQTQYGWHIIKRIDRKSIPPFEEITGELKDQIAKDQRGQIAKNVFLQKIKKEYNFTEYLPERNDFYTVIDDSYFSGKWRADNANTLNQTMFTLLNRKYTQQDFAQYIEKQQTKRKKAPVKQVVNNLYKQYVEESCIGFEDSRLEMKYPEFKALINEYRDGILLFELTDRKVWSRALKDTTGLKVFYENNKTNYMWDDRLDASIYTCYDKSIVKKARKLANNRVKKGYSIKEIIEMIASGDKGPKVLEIEDGKFPRQENDIIDSIEWVVGLSRNLSPETFPGKTGKGSVGDVKKPQVVFVYVNNILKPSVKTLIEARGLVTADYQSYLEKEWIESMKKKYIVYIDQMVLSSIK
ncbi:MAG: peptidylprolyl isomerase [Bacteroidota bacterium]